MLSPRRAATTFPSHRLTAFRWMSILLSITWLSCHIALGSPTVPPSDSSPADTNAATPATSYQNAAAWVVSSAIRYGPTWAHSVERSVLLRLEDTVSIRDFGAVDDYNPQTHSGTDNAPFMQRAIDALCMHGGGGLYVPAGAYAISEHRPITLSCPGLHLYGAGIGATRLILTATERGTPLFVMASHPTDSGMYFYGGEIDHLSVDAAAAGNSQGAIFSIVHCRGCSIHDVSIFGAQYAVRNFAGNGVTVHDFQFYQMRPGGIAIENTGEDIRCTTSQSALQNCPNRADVFREYNGDVTAALSSVTSGPPADCIYMHDFAQTMLIQNVVCEQTRIGLHVDCLHSSGIGTCPGFIYLNRLEIECLARYDERGVHQCLGLCRVGSRELAMLWLSPC